MRILEFDGSFEDVVGAPTVDDIKADGFTIRSGNKLLHLSVTEEKILPEDELKKEYSEKIKEIYNKLISETQSYKNTLKQAFDVKISEYNEKLEQLKKKETKISTLPDIQDKHAHEGLSVVNSNDGIKWYFNCVYNPKYINNKRIEPSFAKRLMTPVTIEISTRDNIVYGIRVLKIIGHEKFLHYHSLNGTADCWGDFRFSGDRIETADEALVYARKVLLLLDTINEFSLGKRNPKGLSRFDTLKKHLLNDNDDQNDKKTGINSRNQRSGFDTSINDEISNDMVWTTS